MNEIKQISQLKSIKPNSTDAFAIDSVFGKVVCQDILRVVPHRRLVARGRCHDRLVIVKLFYGGSVKKYIDREIRGASLLADAHVLAPKILYCGKSNVPGVNLELLEYLPQKKNIDEIWYGDGSEPLIMAMQKIIAAQHHAGCYHIDLHPHNFLLHDEELFVGDFSAVRKSHHAPLCQRKSLENLVLLYAQICLKDQLLIVKFFEQYCQLRHWSCDQVLIDKMMSLLYKKRFERIQSIQNRYLRNCTLVLYLKAFRKHIWCLRELYNKEMQSFLREINAHIEKGKIIKAGNTCTVIKVKFNGQWYVIKRYNIKNARHFLKKCLRTSRAIKSWSHAHMLRVLGVATPKPIAVVENRFGFFKGVTYFICEYVEGETLKYFVDKKKSPDHRTVEQVANLLRLLEYGRISHCDLKSSNFILSKQGSVIVDLDAMRFHSDKKIFSRARAKDIKRFLENWADQPPTQSMFKLALNKKQIARDQAYAVDVSVLIVSYHSADLLKACVDSILKQKQITYEIIVVDNASQDDSVQVIKQLPVTGIFNTENIGFGRANNQAFLKAKGRYILLLNPDAEIVEQDFLQRLFVFMENNSQYGLVSAKVLDLSGEKETKPKKYYPGEKQAGLPYQHLQGEFAWVLGACMMIPHQIYAAVHGFDEDYFLYGEDADICLRVRQLGYEIGYYTDVHIKHVGGASETTNSCYNRIYKKHTALHIFYRKHYSALVAARVIKHELCQAKIRKFYYKCLLKLGPKGKALEKYDRYRAIVDVCLDARRKENA